jgi:aminocarboxymuconate-semialdehyde decarboxylase
MSNFKMDRRHLLAGAATLAVSDQASAQEAKASSLDVIDFHNHYIGPSFKITAPGGSPAQDQVNRNLASPSALLESIELAGIKARVVNTPTAFLEDADGKVPAETYLRINDELANLAAKNPGKIYALASIDAWSGDAGGREVRRAVKELGLRGIYIESARGDLLLNAPQARPTLAAAAELGVPVFIHPQTDKPMHERFSRTGALGARYARGTINSLALISLLEGGVFDELPKLKVVVTTLAMGGIMMAGGFGAGYNIRKDAPELARRHVYVDTMGLNGPQVAAAVAMLGADHVMAGTDWPIVVEKSVPERLKAAMASANLSQQDQEAISHRNLEKLLGIG